MRLQLNFILLRPTSLTAFEIADSEVLLVGAQFTAGGRSGVAVLCSAGPSGYCPLPSTLISGFGQCGCQRPSVAIQKPDPFHQGQRKPQLGLVARRTCALKA